MNWVGGARLAIKLRGVLVMSFTHFPRNRVRQNAEKKLQKVSLLAFCSARY